MGYQRPTLKLIFADEEMEGLEVRARRLSVEELLHIFGMADAEHLASNPTAERVERADQLLAALAATLLSWNLEDRDGVPVPLTVEGLRTQDMPLIVAVRSALLDASTGVSRPLPPASPDGEPSLEESIPMEVL